MDIPSLQRKLDEAKYICTGDVAATLLVALQLGRPLLIGGRRSGPGAGAAAML